MISGPSNNTHQARGAGRRGSKTKDRLMNQRRAIDDATKVDGLEMVKEDIKIVEKDRMGGSQVKKDNNGGYRNNLGHGN